MAEGYDDGDDDADADENEEVEVEERISEKADVVEPVGLAGVEKKMMLGMYFVVAGKKNWLRNCWTEHYFEKVVD